MKSKLTLLASAFGVAVFVSGCYQSRETAPPPPPETAAPAAVSVVVQAPPIAYYYYPDAEVYYRPENKVYWWHDAGAWVSGPRPPSRIVLRDDRRLRVNLNASEPWRQHDTVLKQHPRNGRDRRDK